MSLINDMLKDLDARRPGRRRSQAEALEGLGASRPRESERMLRISTRISAVLLVALLGVGSWSGFAAYMQRVATRGVADAGEPSALVMAEATKLLGLPSKRLPEVSQAGPAAEPGGGELRNVVLEQHASRTRLVFELSRETAHTISRDPSHDRLEILLDATTLVDALPELDLVGTPIQAIRAQQRGEDLSVELELAPKVRTQSSMLGNDASTRLVLDFHGAKSQRKARAKKSAPAPARPAFEKTARPPSVQELAIHATDRALQILRAGDEEAAIEGFSDALAFNPQHQPAREALASLFLQLGRGTEAEALLDSGLMLDPDSGNLVKLKARALGSRAAFAEALELLDRFKRPLARDPEYHVLLAAFYQQTGDYAKASAQYKRVLSWQADKAVWWMGLGISLEGEGKPAEAFSAYQAAAILGGLGEDSQLYLGERIAALQSEAR